MKVDYSGLRVQAIQISDKEDNEKREDPGDNWEESKGRAEKSSCSRIKQLWYSVSCFRNSYRNLESTVKHQERQKDKEMEKSFEVVRPQNRGREEVSKNQVLKFQLDNQ
ncbi:hypothetical protein U0070_002297 [Myodes glareolus]|uniref:Uncharacterized protein n=1 Tax=Myodes glareolus TaxID=447135 RepID=A0AAW0IB17_MYOGA